MGVHHGFGILAMSRPTTPSFVSSFNAAETPNALITLLKLTDQETGAVFRFCNDSVNVPAGPDGEEYIAYPFDAIYPSSEEGKISQAALGITNVDRTLIDNLRAADKPLLAEITAVLSDDFTTPIATWTGYEWKELSWVPTAINGTLTLESFLNEPFPKKLMGGQTNPGLFYGQ